MAGSAWSHTPSQFVPHSQPCRVGLGDSLRAEFGATIPPSAGYRWQAGRPAGQSLDTGCEKIAQLPAGHWADFRRTPDPSGLEPGEFVDPNCRGPSLQFVVGEPSLVERVTVADPLQQ